MTFFPNNLEEEDLFTARESGEKNHDMTPAIYFGDEKDVISEASDSAADQNGMTPAIYFVDDEHVMTPAVNFEDEKDVISEASDSAADQNGMIPAIYFVDDNDQLQAEASAQEKPLAGNFKPVDETKVADSLVVVPSDALVGPPSIVQLPLSRHALEPIHAASDSAEILDPIVFIEELNDIAALLDDFKRRAHLRLFAMEPYCFDPRVGHYRKLEMKELRIKADQLFHNKIMSLKNPVKGYNDLASLLTCQSDLVVDDAFEAKDEYIWAFRNVLVDIASGEVWPNDGSVFLLSSLQCDYDPAAECPGFDSIISYAAMGSPEIEALLWEVIGYILSPDIKAKKFFVFSGVKNSGKSLLANVLREMIGEDSVCALNTSQMSKDFALGDIWNKRLNVCMDLADVTISPEVVGYIKMLTGSDMIRSDRKYRSSIQFVNTAKILLGTNYHIQLKEPDDAFLDRMVLVPFRHSVPEGMEDKHLLEKLRAEYPGIANKAIRHYLKLKQNGLVFTKAIIDDAQLAARSQIINYKKLNEEAILNCFELTGDMRDVVSSELAYRVYSEWCARRQIKPDTQNNFSRDLRAYSLDKKKARIGSEKPVNAFFGIKPKNN